jgi:hypothetical protein
VLQPVGLGSMMRVVGRVRTSGGRRRGAAWNLVGERARAEQGNAGMIWGNFLGHRCGLVERSGRFNRSGPVRKRKRI